MATSATASALDSIRVRQVVIYSTRKLAIEILAMLSGERCPLSARRHLTLPCFSGRMAGIFVFILLITPPLERYRYFLKHYQQWVNILSNPVLGRGVPLWQIVLQQLGNSFPAPQVAEADEPVWQLLMLLSHGRAGPAWVDCSHFLSALSPYLRSEPLFHKAQDTLSAFAAQERAPPDEEARYLPGLHLLLKAPSILPCQRATTLATSLTTTTPNGPTCSMVK